MDQVDMSHVKSSNISFIEFTGLSRPLQASPVFIMKTIDRFSQSTLNKCSFSIDHILNVAGSKVVQQFESPEEEDIGNFEWLTCTRYRPPRLPRTRRKEVQRRKLGRNPRIPFSTSQVALLEARFTQTPYLSSSDVTQLASYLQLSETRVKIWFQNRRARERRDKEVQVDKVKNETDKERNSWADEHTSTCTWRYQEPADMRQLSCSVSTAGTCQQQDYHRITLPLDLHITSPHCGTIRTTSNLTSKITTE